ncbi:hypothetical protein TELCIR_17276 [Teladorsagia circumcincta]|uniref:Uncharacterized protein n=1 Tax=Teladorsagia circumcincta TaxID=45464 RepID=A0A2G9TTE2_TELCI|nr:hypothetical protein TELCIR_17276 [Teladorsagia circumcincta]
MSIVNTSTHRPYIHSVIDCRMFYAVTLPLYFLFIVQANGFNLNPFGGDFDPFPDFSGGIFDSGWWSDLWADFEKLFPFGRVDVDIKTENGTTWVTTEIGGKQYNATFHDVQSISSSKKTVHENGTVTELFTLKVNNETYTYKTLVTTQPPQMVIPLMFH